VAEETDDDKFRRQFATALSEAASSLLSD